MSKPFEHISDERLSGYTITVTLTPDQARKLLGSTGMQLFCFGQVPDPIELHSSAQDAIDAAIEGLGSLESTLAEEIVNQVISALDEEMKDLFS